MSTPISPVRTQSQSHQSEHEARRQSAAREPGLEDSQENGFGIPEDDGMSSLRQQLHEIRLLAVTTEEKARRMHGLMTKAYVSDHAGEHDHRHQHIAPVTPVEKAKLESNPYRVLPGDLEPSYSPLPANTNAAELLNNEEEEEEEALPALGCMHYKRNVKIQCFDCERWYPCRHCHDTARDLPYQHTLNRKKTRNMLCMLCKTPQPAAEVCQHCGEYAAWYYCSKCKLWDNDSNKKIYHCDDCGLCRIGEGLGKDFVHCRRCNVCISIATSAAHPCIERATDSDCPLCLSYLFESTTPVVSLPCGHYMHGECYKDLMAVTYKCPVCSKSAVNMETQWRKLDDEIAAQPMPDDDLELANLMPHIERAASIVSDDVVPQGQRRRPRDVWIGCNDCGARCYTPFHWLGLKCQVCGGYNTNQMAPPAGRETEAERILRQQQAQHRQHDFSGNFVLRDGGIGIETEGEDNERTDSAYARSMSPASDPAQHQQTIRRASEAHSPGRRYFVQLEEPRRSSFTAPRMPNLPRMPDLPSLQDMALPNLPRMPDMTLPSLPQMQMPNLPNLPRLPDMVAVLSRSLSPMRYYREGSETRRDDLTSSQTSNNRRAYWRNSAPPGTIEDQLQEGLETPRNPVRQNSLNVERLRDMNDSAVDSDDEEVNDEDFFESLIGHR